MDDLISRQAAISRAVTITMFGRDIRVVGVSELENLPSAQPERKNGYWKMVPDPYGFFEEIPVCSECGCTTEMRKTYKFCPNCGADMRGEQNETD